MSGKLIGKHKKNMKKQNLRFWCKMILRRLDEMFSYLWLKQKEQNLSGFKTMSKHVLSQKPSHEQDETDLWTNIWWNK